MTVGRRAYHGGAMSLGILMLAMFVVSSLSAASLEEQVQQVAAELRCPVCQGLSVADSPAKMAEQMRGLVRERLEAGESPEAVKAYFVERYGEWILLTPKQEGFNLLVWVLPFLGLGGGAVGVFLVLRRWRQRTPTAPASVDPAYLEKVRREMAQD
ncbi:MAG: cytochrome c-type biogenesis protein CcmH [Nitrospinota bacterium]